MTESENSEEIIDLTLWEDQNLDETETVDLCDVHHFEDAPHESWPHDEVC